MIFQPSLSIFRSFSDSMAYSWTIDKRIKSDSAGRHPPEPAPTGQVSSLFSCYTPRITHFLTINPSQMYRQVIIYTEASQSEADPPFSNFISPQIGRGQVLQRGKQLHLWDQSWGNPFGLLALLLIGQQGNCHEKMCKITEAFSVQVAAAEWR